MVVDVRQRQEMRENGGGGGGGGGIRVVKKCSYVLVVGLRQDPVVCCVKRIRALRVNGGGGWVSHKAMSRRADAMNQQKCSPSRKICRWISLCSYVTMMVGS